MMDMQTLMESAVGHEVEVYTTNGFLGRAEPCVGKCVGYTQPLDNEPEVAAIDIKVPGFSCRFEINEEQIEKLIIKS